MRATVMYRAGDVRVQGVPDPAVQEPTDAVVRVLRAAICGSDLWPYGSMPAAEQGRPMGMSSSASWRTQARRCPG
jgi:threonine dehydrogenase-like Zn-dependent dehydrogenase